LKGFAARYAILQSPEVKHHFLPSWSSAIPGKKRKQVCALQGFLARRIVQRSLAEFFAGAAHPTRGLLPGAEGAGRNPHHRATTGGCTLRFSASPAVEISFRAFRVFSRLILYGRGNPDRSGQDSAPTGNHGGLRPTVLAGVERKRADT
jgi:hypothetical protein